MENAIQYFHQRPSLDNDALDEDLYQLKEDRKFNQIWEDYLEKVENDEKVNTVKQLSCNSAYQSELRRNSTFLIQTFSQLDHRRVEENFHKNPVNIISSMLGKSPADYVTQVRELTPVPMPRLMVRCRITMARVNSGGVYCMVPVNLMLDLSRFHPQGSMWHFQEAFYLANPESCNFGVAKEYSKTDIVEWGQHCRLALGVSCSASNQKCFSIKTSQLAPYEGSESDLPHITNVGSPHCLKWLKLHFNLSKDIQLGDINVILFDEESRRYGSIPFEILYSIMSKKSFRYVPRVIV